VPYAFENRRLLREIYELFPDEGKRCLPFAMLDPMREQRADCGTAAPAGRLRFYGLKIQTTIIQSFIKTLGEEGRGFVEFAAEWDIPFIIHSSVGDDDPWAQASDILDIVENFRTCASASRTRAVTTRNASTAWPALPNAWFDCAAHCIHCDGAVADMPFIARRRDASSRISPIRARHRGPRSGVSDEVHVGHDSPYYQLRGDARRRTPRADQQLCEGGRGVAGASQPRSSNGSRIATSARG